MLKPTRIITDSFLVVLLLGLLLIPVGSVGFSSYGTTGFEDILGDSIEREHTVVTKNYRITNVSVEEEEALSEEEDSKKSTASGK